MDEILKRKDFDMNEFFVIPTINEKNNENDKNKGGLLINFNYKKTKAKRNSKRYKLKNFKLYIKANTNSYKQLNNININVNDNKDDNNEIHSLFKKKTKKSNNSFGDNVSKNYKTLKLKKKSKDFSGPRYMKFRNRSNVSFSYNSAIMSNYYISNNENPYTEDISYIMNDNIDFDINLQNKDHIEESSISLNKLNLNSEFIIKNEEEIVDINKNLFELNLDLINKNKKEEKIVVDLKKALNMMCGFTEFKQGGGKSLCYQLASYIYKNLNIPNLTLVISPTISLMQDQLYCLPKTLEGAVLVSSMSESEIKNTIQQIINKKKDVLFITPERLHSKKFQELLKEFPPINFVCIDEVHCLSEWSHNFRSSYLYLNQIIKEVLNIRCVIGLTGSLTKETQSSIIKMLDIPEKNVISGNLVRNNIRMTISKDQDRENALISLLRTPCFHNLNSIIIYCMKQNQCDSLASHLRAYGFQAESYHAGKDRVDREMTQNKFIKGNLRIIVATIAFGLGVNKPDVRGVIHFNMPKSIENYTQEIGRSGRDGLTSYCHLFLSSNDYIKMRSLAYSEGIDLGSIKEMLNKIILDNNENTQVINDIKKVFLPIDETEIRFDMKKETISTLLNYLEIEDKSIKTFLPISSKVTIKTYKYDLNQIEEKENYNEVINFLINNSEKIKQSYLNKSVLEENIKNLNIDKEKWVNLLSNKLYERVKNIENSKVKKVDQNAASESLSENSIYWESENNNKIIDEQNGNEYKTKIDDQNEDDDEKKRKFLNCTLENKLRKGISDYFTAMDVDVKTFILDNIDEIKNGRAVARIFHGISSPKFPASKWYKNKLWGKYINISFDDIERIANIAFKNFKNKKII
ncbi:ATP-dependent DNA helicase [Neocallimastix lanati (nom. inval.)]|uniref:DNA 3'-5' helicase n=1 Tax=Neocallimastix californiae TaxID=1754190 RepID=A0A1Y2EQB1_9FUNG|nr:ATP-dependent DNA helicase [Neocallimastix sp. JGI-2020a]ORY73025.1 ATP-dependent DNA helicase [Neocallimastix californiae]|eukprot:ORY73025.1 ATP-dependent DNA helicase [Neocallimastix californiae]